MFAPYSPNTVRPLPWRSLMRQLRSTSPLRPARPSAHFCAGTPPQKGQVLLRAARRLTPFGECWAYCLPVLPDRTAMRSQLSLRPTFGHPEELSARRNQISRTRANEVADEFQQRCRAHRARDVARRIEPDEEVLLAWWNDEPNCAFGGLTAAELCSCGRAGELEQYLRGLLADEAN